MANFMQPDAQTTRLTTIPSDLPILPLRSTLAYPFSVMPLAIGIPRSIRLIEEALQGDRLIGLVGMPDGKVEEPMPGQMYETGTMANIQNVSRGQDNTLQVVVQGIERFRIAEWIQTTPYLRARVTLATDLIESDVETEALQATLRDLAQQVVALSPHVPRELRDFLGQVHDARLLVYMVAAIARLDVSEGQQILEMDSVKEKFQRLITHLTHEKEILSIRHKIQTEAREEMDKAQREYYLRQQLKALQKELGETDESRATAEDYRQKIEAALLPEEARQEALRELKRLESLPPQAAEYGIIKTYLDWLVQLPWNVLSADQFDIPHARTVLDEDHYDLQEVKDRILEFLAVRKLNAERHQPTETDTEPVTTSPTREAMGAILCFAGPPGVGKTSLGQSVARALGRKFTRMSLGGMRDEAEIRGHRRTYIGAMPGRIVQALKRAGTRNPVFMLDEIDKIGHDWRGDPSSALLEVLDPAQNKAFRDHYLDVDFDLSDVMFITTANQLETIPEPLRDRMEILQLDGYTEHEKVHIAQAYLVPRQRQANGLHPEEVTFTDEALRKITRDYTREAGVRNLERRIGTICRKVAVQITSQAQVAPLITPERVLEYLKHEPFVSELHEQLSLPGIATGLAVTATGGDILYIEATRMQGKGNLTLTGHLGDVMRESAQIAYSYVRAKAPELGVDAEAFANTDLHVHVPAGAIPKDGPSAGVAMVSAMTSLLTGRPVRHDVGMTGEITLRGRVLPVGGVKMKVLAAHRAGLTTVILPKRNEHDLEELPNDVRQELTFVPVEMIDEVLTTALQPVVEPALAL
ncbi:MAG: endopeptidase La [Candidatus Tectomicrobia bacterium]|uniref:Lon protease n=1 Tax=Tectimicrobiota bacterium TaxID=2528274 RepID=A0A938B1X2_UNCTE|nr:endopeptidase La [Candidatus Tectomicrobia bacterium]